MISTHFPRSLVVNIITATLMFVDALVFCLTGLAVSGPSQQSLCRMGVSASNQEFRELPNKATDATLYYFAGRGLADQIR